MAIQHQSIADADRHEPKHASTATLNQANLSNGDGTTRYAFVSYSNITGTPSAQGYQSVLYGSSTATTQAPVAVNTALQVEFGPLQSTPSVSLSAAGVLTFNETGYYIVDLFLRFGRTTGAGTAIVFNRLLINGVQSLNSNSLSMTDTAQVVPFSAAIPMFRTAGDTFSVQILRDSAGVNNGGLQRTDTSASGWNFSPSASISVSKFGGLV